MTSPNDIAFAPTAPLGLLTALSPKIMLGRAFAFLSRAALSSPDSAGLSEFVGEGRHLVVPLLGREKVSLLGAEIRPSPIARLRLAHVTTDRALYREGRDSVGMLVVDPVAPGLDATVLLSQSGVEFSRHTVRLDPNGVGAVTLKDLPVGDYAVRLRGAPADEDPHTFTVAAFRLSPLTATLTDRRVEPDGSLAVHLALHSFGAPVDGAVKIDVTDRGRFASTLEAVCRAGALTATVALTGEGPHALNLQLKSDPSRTATVPLLGSRAVDRALTTFSSLGTEVRGSLLPSEDARPVRGVFLEGASMRNTPFRLERVDASSARLIATTAAQCVRVICIDPTVPVPRADAVDPRLPPSSGNHDPARYERGEALFKQGAFADARRIFEEAWASLATPHPNYAYYIACCYARERDVPRALSALRVALSDGWIDHAHMATDGDLANLAGDPGFDLLVRRGCTVISREAMLPGEVIEVPVRGPLGLFALGAFVSDTPWEGWASVLTPGDADATIECPSMCAPGDTLDLAVRCPDGASVYVIVRDARLQATDTPVSRMASGLKRCVQRAGERLTVASVTASLASVKPVVPQMPPIVPPTVFGPPPNMPMRPPMPQMPPPPYGTPNLPMPPGFDRMYGAAPTGPRPAAPAAAPWGAPSGAMPPTATAGPRVAESTARPAAMPPPAPAARPAMHGGFNTTTSAPSPVADAAAGRMTLPSIGPVVLTRDDPDVLFAGLVSVHDGVGAVSVALGDGVRDLAVSAFVIHSGGWGLCEARARAEKMPYASLDLPPYVYARDVAVGRLHVGAQSGRVRVKVTRDGEPVALMADDRALVTHDVDLRASRSEITFVATAGFYEAQVEDLATGVTDRTYVRVSEPGKLRRVARSLVLLSPGESLERARDASVISLRVIPGLDRPMRALIDATADYGHACCEQTAAKIMAGCAMYATAGDNRLRRATAEAVVLAGVRRERSMWLKGRGFKMYPESHGVDTYWGPLAARYLWNLSLLRDAAGAGMTFSLREAIDEGLGMAQDVTHAYGMDFPPRAPALFADAYAMARFGGAPGAERAMSFVTERSTGRVGWSPQAPLSVFAAAGKVRARADGAWAAATMLRAGGARHRAAALAMSNAVTRELNDAGRLYSTEDSVAALGMMSELIAAGVVSSGSEIEVDGRRCTSAEASGWNHGIAQSVRSISAVAAVEVARVVEEDWDAWASQIPFRVALEKGGRATQRLRAGDPVDLHVTLEEGYQAGDLLWVTLPDALSRVVGGGQVKMFSEDFAGRSELRIPLAATGLTIDRDGRTAAQHFALCVRNMFVEERAGSAGYLDVTVSP